MAIFNFNKTKPETKITPILPSDIYDMGVLELKDKILGCFCKNDSGNDIPCHGDVYVEWLNNN